MSRANLVKTIGQEAIDALELRNRSGSLRQSEVQVTLDHWESVRGGYRKAQDFESARAAGEVISRLTDLLSRADDR